MIYFDFYLYTLQIQHSKSYENEVEERFRMKIYLENRHKIAKHNKESHIHGYSLGKHTFFKKLPFFEFMIPVGFC